MKSTETMQLSRWYGIIAIQLLNVILALVILNMGLYIFFSVFDRFRDDPSKDKLFHGRSSLTQMSSIYPDWKESELAILLTEDENMEYVFDPWSQMKIGEANGDYINVSEYGFRFVKNQGSWPPDPTAINIFVFGGSTSFGVGVADDQTIPSYLQEFLQEDQLNKIFVYNFARPGSFSTTERILFEQLATEGIIPDIAIFIDGLNDFSFWSGEPQWTNQLRELVLRANSQRALVSRSWYHKATDILSHLPIYRVARSAKGQLNRLSGDEETTYTEALRKGDPPYQNNEVLESAINRWFTNKSLIETAATKFQVTPLFVWHPIATYKYSFTNHPLYNGDPIYFGVTQRAPYGYALMEKSHLPILNQEDNFLWLADIQESEKNNLYVDNSHFTGRFAKQISSHISQYINKQRLLPTN